MQSYNSTNRFGSAAWSNLNEVRRSGLLAGSGHLIGHLDGQALTLDADAPLLTISGSGGGKTSQILASAILANPAQPRMVLDPRGEIVSVTLPAFATAGTYVWIWNPTGMHGLARHAVQCLDILDLDAPTFHADCDFISASLIPVSGSASGKYFELRSREWLKNIMKALVERDGFVSFPSLWHAISSVEGDTASWADLVEFMLVSSMEGVRRTAGEMLAKQQESPREFGGVMGELYSYLSFLDDPMLQAALDRSDFSFATLCDSAQAASVFIVVPVAYIPIWAPVLRTMFTVLMLYKSRAVAAPRIQLLVDEAGQLGHFEALVRAMTFGRGDGISAWPFFQDTGQLLRHYGPSGLQTFMGSSALRQFFGVRDYETARMVSDMLGTETLEYDDTLRQEAARRDRVNAAMAFMNGSDPFQALNNMRSHRFGELHQTKQSRALMTPDEILAMPEDRQIMFISGKNLRPVYAQKFPYYTRPEFAGRYLPNPFHPPLDRVPIAGRWRSGTAKVIREPVPPEFAHLPQYAAGLWEYVQGHRPKPRRIR